MGVLGDFSGDPTTALRPLADRKFIQIDRDNFDDVMSRVAPGLKLKVDNVERERDFYFDKLRDIEILCQMPLLQSIPVSMVLAYQSSNIINTAPCDVMC